MTIGEKFRTVREEKGFTLSEIQEKIKIRTRYLEALENDDYDLIPGEAYVKVFIKGYANFLGLDHIELVEQYEMIKNEEERQEEEENGDSESEEKHNKTLVSFLIIVVILALLAFLIYNAYLLNNTKNEIDLTNSNGSQEVAAIIDNSKLEEEEVRDVDKIDNKEEISKEENNSKEIKGKTINENENSKEENKTTNLKKKNIEKKNIEILVKEKSWIQIVIDGNNTYEGILDRGANKSFSFSDNVSLKIGNAAGIQVRKDNKTLGPWGEQGEVIKKIIEF